MMVRHAGPFRYLRDLVLDDWCFWEPHLLGDKVILERHQSLWWHQQQSSLLLEGCSLWRSPSLHLWERWGLRWRWGSGKLLSDPQLHVFHFQGHHLWTFIRLHAAGDTRRFMFFTYCSVVSLNSLNPCVSTDVQGNRRVEVFSSSRSRKWRKTRVSLGPFFGLQ